MIAKQLESILSSEASKTDFTYRAPGDLVQRFQSLRGCGLLPKGRGRNAEHLSSAQTAAGILSIVAETPGYAGVGTKSLLRLRPVGGPDASFFNAPTLGHALANILEIKDALDAVLEVRVSGSEIYKNGYGRATIEYEIDHQHRTAHFVGELAYSLMGQGAELKFNPRDLISTTIKETVYFRRFFDRISRQLSIKYPKHAFDHLIDPDEEELERLEEERKKRLGILPSSQFLNLAVDTQVTWPDEEAVIDFGGHRIILMPQSKNADTSIHVDLHGQKVSDEQAHTLINRFLSVMAWCCDQPAILQEGWSGTRYPVPASKKKLAFHTAYGWFFDRKLATDHDTRIALALYREGRNAEENYLVAYGVLSYYKIIEVKHPGKSASKKWFKENYASFREDAEKHIGFARFESACGAEPPHEYIYKACRVAVAHVNERHLSDPDDFNEIRRLHIVADVMRGLARYFIKTELGVSDSFLDGT